MAALAAVAALIALAAPGVVRGLPLASGPHSNHDGGTPTETTPTAPTTEGGIPVPQGYASVLDFSARSPQRPQRPYVSLRLHVPAKVELAVSLNRTGASSAVYQYPTITKKPLPHLVTRVFLPLPKTQLRIVKGELANRKRMELNVIATVTDEAGKQSKASRQITLRRKVTKASVLGERISRLRKLINAVVGPLTTKTVKGPQGPAGPPGRSALSGLGPNETIRGVVGDQFQVPKGSELTVIATATFPVPIPFGLDDPHVVVDGYYDETRLDNPNPCTGSADAPTAPPGFVCVYPYWTDNVACDPPPAEVTDCGTQPAGIVAGRGDARGKALQGQQKWGFQVSWGPACESPYPALCTDYPAYTTAFFANWAYTAPADAPAPAGGHDH